MGEGEAQTGRQGQHARQVRVSAGDLEQVGGVKQGWGEEVGASVASSDPRGLTPSAIFLPKSPEMLIIVIVPPVF